MKSLLVITTAGLLAFSGAALAQNAGAAGATGTGGGLSGSNTGTNGNGMNNGMSQSPNGMNEGRAASDRPAGDMANPAPGTVHGTQQGQTVK